MFKVYAGLTVGMDYESDAEFSDPVAALADLKGRDAGLLVIEQSNDDGRYTILYVKAAGKVFNCLTGQMA